MKKKQTKKIQIKKRAHPMSIVSPEKERLVLSCTKEEKRYIKVLAAKNNMTMSEYLLSFARKEMPKSCSQHCERSHVPNKETAKVLKETDEGKNLVEYDNIDDFWDALGFKKYA